ncbi:Exportin-2 [Folsomia candida]|uniref:Exportin-2 n=1 Tax=Folsomia candida TaxID=158441 RepID=A0A226F5A3_FOLCA|nr:Exportin-2 [Folsomia candida]
MENKEQALQHLATYIAQTLSPDPAVRKPAEKHLESVEGNLNYPLLLLHLVNTQASGGSDPAIPIAAAIAFKNFVRRNWSPDEDAPNKIHATDREAIKAQIVELMLKSPEAIQRQLSDAISAIGRYDFPQQWSSLMPTLVAKLGGTDDFHVINGVLQTCHSLFKRYRHEFKSDKLWSEIKLVLDSFAAPLTQLFTTLMGLAKQHEGNKAAITIIYSSILLVAKIFYSLNSQEIPEFFEDNIKVWMPNFHILLTTDNPLLKTGEDEEAGLLEQLRSQICDNVGMYARKYDEEFEEFLPIFVTDIWGLLVTTGAQTKYDMLVSNAIGFLALVAEKDRNKALFNNPETMSGICQKVIVPNMEFRDADEELFEDNPEEYIRRDIEGSDVDTRRRAVCDLVRALSKNFESEMTSIFGAYVQEMLVKYGQNASQAWKSKDAAIYLVTSIVAKGQTEKDGVTKTNSLVSVVDFYNAHILSELLNPDVNQIPVLKADSIKYLMIFRNQLPPQTMKEGISHLVRFLGAESTVVNSYAASAIEKLLLLKQADNSPLIQTGDLAPVGATLISGLFSVLSKPTSKENEYVMKAIMRSTSALGDGAAPFMGVMLPKLLEILVGAARNPSKPHFNHYMFETLCLSIRILCRKNPAAVEQFEVHLFPIFQGILQGDVVEFIPYVFQVLALMLDYHPAGSGVTEPYMFLFPCLLAPPLWEKNANIPPLVQLLKIYVKKGVAQIVASDKLGAMLGVFQKLIASKSNDHEGFNLIRCLVDNLPPTAMEQYLKSIFLLLFQRLTSSKTVKFVKCLLVYFATYINRYGAESFIAMIDSIEPNFMAKVLDRLFIAEMQKIGVPLEKRIVGVGVTKLLCECPQSMLTGQYAMYWPPLLQAIIQMFECPEDVAPLVASIAQEAQNFLVKYASVANVQIV